MRDPLDPKPKAFEILGIGFSATEKEMVLAYARLVRETRQPQKRQEITLAFQRMRRLEGRLEEDAWCYRMAQKTLVPGDPGSEDERLLINPVFPTLGLDPELTELADETWRGDLVGFEFQNFAFVPLAEYTACPPIVTATEFES